MKEKNTKHKQRNKTMKTYLKQKKTHGNYIVFISNNIPCLNLIAFFLFLDMPDLITNCNYSVIRKICLFLKICFCHFKITILTYTCMIRISMYITTNKQYKWNRNVTICTSASKKEHKIFKSLSERLHKNNCLLNHCYNGEMWYMLLKTEKQNILNN